MAGIQDKLNNDYVYVSETTNEFVHAQVRIVVGDEDADVFVTPQEMITCGELNTVIEYLQNDILKKIKMHISEGFNVFVVFDGVTYEVELKNGVAAAIKEIELL